MWNVRSNDGAMNGLEFARCTTADGLGAARPARLPTLAQ